MKKIYITVVKSGDDCGQVVQYAHSIEQAQMLISKVMPKLLNGYYYKIN